MWNSMGTSPLATTVAAAALFVATTGDVFAQHVRINEARIDQPGADTDEYFELSGLPGTDLADVWYIVIGDGPGGSGVVEHALDLSGSVIGADSFFLVAESGWTGDPLEVDLEAVLNFENGDNVTHVLVTEFAGLVNDDLDIDDDGILDTIPWTTIIDDFALIEEGGTGDLVYSDTRIGPDGQFVPSHVYRYEDHWGGWNIGPLDPIGGDDTGGMSNAFRPGWITLALTGGCEGEVIAEVTGALPDASVWILVAREPGGFFFPNQCFGLQLTLSRPIWARQYTADGSGYVNSGPVTVGPSGCGTWIQAVDEQACRVTNMVQIQ
ncbi:MAG: hypothetical protein D8M59_11650 [Planctomycetes bacterium]|nr:hypothetical protein [Planctomycetota bacterium]